MIKIAKEQCATAKAEQTRGALTMNKKYTKDEILEAFPFLNYKAYESGWKILKKE